LINYNNYDIIYMLGNFLFLSTTSFNIKYIIAAMKMIEFKISQIPICSHIIVSHIIIL